MTSRERDLEAKLRLRTDERDVARAGRAAALRSNARWDDVQDDMCYGLPEGVRKMSDDYVAKFVHDYPQFVDEIKRWAVSWNKFEPANEPEIADADLDPEHVARSITVAKAFLKWSGQTRAAEKRAERAEAALREHTTWRPMETAPKDGTYIIARCEHVNAKYSKDPIAERWIAPVLAQWIDHNGGGWTWSGHAGRFTGWLPLPPLAATE